MTDISERILHEDDHLLVVDKPSGLLVHRGWGRDRVTLVDMVQEYLGEEKVHPIHRLDRPTSGVIVFARTSDVARKLGQAADADTMNKHYLALVRGHAPDSGVIDHPIPTRKDGPRGEAVTSYRTRCKILTEPREVSLIEASLEHGRMHQVRRHFRHINHPIIGDTNYGHNALNRGFAEKWELRRLALHAVSITFAHPDTGSHLRFTAQVPDDLKVPLTKMGFPAESLDY